ncbi:hypothetical protein MPSI1_003948 [Malassezia psittaci]|uniref:Uncharacterized protein n=1 Tax=Malassezia psittaci TaxID=1821823 RepID=A0AAF0FFW9_9BASI|nr:hypothetical protein MPSI1_003948 [Malassezia psittaci]
MSNRPVCHNVDMPDPWVIPGNGVFYLTFTQGDRIEVWSSPNVEDFNQAQKSCIWRPEGSGWAPGIWAPELHFLGDAWYIYFSGEKPGQGPSSHRTLVLRSSSKDPMDPKGWQFLGPLQGVPDHWAIDATVFTPSPNELYCCWSGWPLGDHSDKEQDLFIAKLSSPTQAIPDTVTVISRPDHDWERPDGGKRGVNEGPTWVSMQGFRGIVYSAHGSWTCDYKLGLLALVGNNPLDPSAWKKRSSPLLMSEREKGGPYGPGHASFVVAPDGSSCLCMFHCTGNVDDGWDNRKARCMELKAQDFAMESSHCCCASGTEVGGGGHGGGHGNVLGKAINKIKSL